MKQEKILMVPRLLGFLRSCAHYLDIFLLSKGYYSKRLPIGLKRDIANKFCRIMHFPSEISNIISSYGFSTLQLDGLGEEDLEVISHITDDDIIHAFTQVF